MISNIGLQGKEKLLHVEEKGGFRKHKNKLCPLPSGVNPIKD